MPPVSQSISQVFLFVPVSRSQRSWVVPVLKEDLTSERFFLAPPFPKTEPNKLTTRFPIFYHDFSFLRFTPSRRVFFPNFHTCSTFFPSPFFLLDPFSILLLYHSTAPIGGLCVRVSTLRDITIDNFVNFSHPASSLLLFYPRGLCLPVVPQALLAATPCLLVEAV